MLILSLRLNYLNVYSEILRVRLFWQSSKLRRNKVEGRELLDRLTEIWNRHSLNEISYGDRGELTPPVPKIICGEIM